MYTEGGDRRAVNRADLADPLSIGGAAHEQQVRVRHHLLHKHLLVVLLPVRTWGERGGESGEVGQVVRCELLG